MFPLPYTPSDSVLTNDALALFFEYIVLYYDDAFGGRIKSEEQMCEYITDLVINEIEMQYQDTNGYMYTGEPQPITPLENTVYINNQYFNQLVTYLSKHIYRTILPEIQNATESLRRNNFRIHRTNMKWSKADPTLLTAIIQYT